MLTPVEVLISVDSHPLPSYVEPALRLMLLAQVCLLPLAARPLGSVGASAVPLYNPYFARNLQFDTFLDIWATLFGLFVATLFLVTGLSRRGARSSKLRAIWVIIKALLLLFTEGALPTVLGTFFAALPCSQGHLRGFPTTACWASPGTAVFVLSLLAFLACAACSVVQSLTLFDSSPLSLSYLSRAHGRVDAFVRLWLPVIILLGHLTTATAFWITLATFSGITAMLYAAVQPFYFPLGNKLHCSIFATTMWLSISVAVETSHLLTFPKALPLYLSAIGVALMAWALGSRRMEKCSVMVLETVNRQWVPRFPVGLQFTRRHSSIMYRDGETGLAQSSCSVSAESGGLLTGGSDASPPAEGNAAGYSVRRVLIATDVELSTRFVATNTAREMHRQGHTNLAPTPWARTIASVADQYFQRGLKKFPESGLVRLHYARFLAWWLDSTDMATVILMGLANDSGVPLDIRFLAAKELAALRGSADDTVIASILKKAKEEHGKALTALLAFLKEAAAHRNETDISALSHLAHLACHRRQLALEFYREGLTRRNKPERMVLVHWAMFLENLMLDHAGSARMYEMLERSETQNSHRSHMSSMTSGSTDIPGLQDTTITSDNADGPQSVGMSKGLQLHVALAFAFLFLLVVGNFGFNYYKSLTSKGGLDRILTVAELRTLVYELSLVAGDVVRSAEPGSASSALLTNLARLSQKFTDAHSQFFEREFPHDLGGVKLSHSLQLTPLVGVINDQTFLRMAAVWEFGDLVATSVLNFIRANLTNASVFDPESAYTDLLRNTWAYGSALNRSIWLYNDLIPYQDRRYLLPQVLLFLAGIFVLTMVALLFLWSFTRIAQQRLVVLKFFTTLTPEVVSGLVSQVEQQMKDFKHPPEISSATVDTYDEDDGEGSILSPMPPFDPGQPASPGKRVVPHPALRKNFSTVSEIPLEEVSRKHSVASSARMFWPSSQPARSPDVLSPAVTDTFGSPLSPSPQFPPRHSLPRVPTLPSVPKIVEPPHKRPPQMGLRVRVLSPETSAPLRRGSRAPVEGSQPLLRAATSFRKPPPPKPAKSTRPKRTTAQRTPFRVFVLLGVLYVLVMATVVLLVGPLVDLGRMEHDTQLESQSMAELTRAWMSHFAKSLQAQKFVFFGQLRRYTQYFALEQTADAAVHALSQFTPSQPLISGFYNAYFVAAARSSETERIAIRLASMCYGLPNYTVPGVAYLRWEGNKNASSTDQLTQDDTLIHSDYETDIASGRSAQCRAAQRLLFTDTYKSSLGAAGTAMQQALEAERGHVRSVLHSHNTDLANSNYYVLGVFLALSICLAALMLELRRRHPSLWASLAVRGLLYAAACGCVMIVASLIPAIVGLQQEVHAIATRTKVETFVVAQERFIVEAGSLAFDFAVSPTMERYAAFHTLIHDFSLNWSDMSFMPPSVMPFVKAVQVQHEQVLGLAHIALTLTTNAMGWGANTFELNTVAWDGTKLPGAHFTTRERDISLSSPEKLQLARTVLCDDLEASRVETLYKLLGKLRDTAESVVADQVEHVAQKRRAVSWLVLAVTACLGSINLSLGILLAVKALDLTGSQALTKLNDPTLNKYVRYQRYALALIAGQFLVTVVVVAVKGLELGFSATELAWAVEQQTSAAECTFHASTVVSAPNNATFARDQQYLSTCVSRMQRVRQELFNAHGGTPHGDLATAYGKPGDATGLYFLYSRFLQIGQRIATAATSGLGELSSLFKELHNSLTQLMPLFSKSRTALLATLNKNFEVDLVLQFTLTACLLACLVLEYVFFYRPMLSQLLEEQAMVRTLLSLIPESALSADMEEFLEKGVVNSDHFIEDDEIVGLQEDRVESEGDELVFMNADTEELSHVAFPAVVCSAEGIILWANKRALAVQTDAVGGHISILVPQHAHCVSQQSVPNDGRNVGIKNGEAALLKLTVRAHPHTGAQYLICSLTPIVDTSLASFRNQIIHGTSVPKATSALETSPVAVLVVDEDGRITYANTKAEKFTGATATQLTERKVRDLIVNPTAIPEEPAHCMVPGGYDVLLREEKPQGNPAPYFLHVQSLPEASQSSSVRVYLVALYPLLPAASRAQTAREGPSSQNRPSRHIKQPKHSEMQQKRCTVLHLEIVQSSLPSTPTLAFATSQKVMNLVHGSAAKHNGHLHCTLGDQAIVTFNHSSANGAHALAACTAAKELLQGLPVIASGDDAPVVRAAVSSSPAFCGYFGRLPILQGECLQACTLMLRAMKETPITCAVDSAVWQAAQYTYHTRLVNIVNPVIGISEMAAPFKAVNVFELGAAKQHELDEWMYQLAQKDSPYTHYVEAVKLAQRSGLQEAGSALEEHLKLSPDDAVATWFQGVLNQGLIVSPRVEWCGSTAFTLEWYVEK